MTLDSSASLFASLSTLVFPEYQNAHPGLVGFPPLKFYMLSLLLTCVKISTSLHCSLSPHLGQSLWQLTLDKDISTHCCCDWDAMCPDTYPYLPPLWPCQQLWSPGTATILLHLRAGRKTSAFCWALKVVFLWPFVSLRKAMNKKRQNPSPTAAPKAACKSLKWNIAQLEGHWTSAVLPAMH